MNTFDPQLLIQSPHSALGASVYAGQADGIKAMVREAKEYLQAVANARITNHRRLEGDVTRTDFDNGVAVWVNYSGREADTPAGTVPANGFIWSRQGGDGA